MKRGGYTTGTCAAAAARGALLTLLQESEPELVRVSLPDDSVVELPLERTAVRGEGKAEAGVIKDAGDDPDVTDGVLVLAEVRWGRGENIRFEGGRGVGTVTRPGLQVDPGEPAINPVPRRMIRRALRELTDRGLVVKISVPEGERLAGETFNPRLGIEGGISILGTTGRVRPFSCPALRQSLVCGLQVAEASGIHSPVLVPGHVGERAAKDILNVSEDEIIPVSNEWGYMLDRLSEGDFDAFTAVGHPGKMAKLAEGHWDTHSSRSPSAVPIVSRLADQLGIEAGEHTTTEGLFETLPLGPSRSLGDALAEKVRLALVHRVDNDLPCRVILVDMQGGMLGRTEGE